MTIIIQQNVSEKIKLDKTLTTITTLTGTLKTDTSITDPVILIECDPTTVVNANYMSITEFGRSYFINNIKVVRKNLVEISAHVDVLSSFKSEIRANSAIIQRQESQWNLYLNDGSFRVYQNPIIQLKSFPNGFSNPEFVFALAGSN